MATLADEFRSFVKCARWVCQENGQLFMETEITPGGTGLIGTRPGRNAPFNMRFSPIVYGFPEGFR